MRKFAEWAISDSAHIVIAGFILYIYATAP